LENRPPDEMERLKKIRIELYGIRKRIEDQKNE